MAKLIFITGGVRSGKSGMALKTAIDAGGPALFVATALSSDREMEERIVKHRSERPAGWRTVEATAGKLSEHLSGPEGVILIDCIALYVSRRLIEGASTQAVLDESREAVEKIIEGFELSVVVSNEVGSGLVADNHLARRFTEVLGGVNRLVADRASDVLLMVSGIPVKVK